MKSKLILLLSIACFIFSDIRAQENTGKKQTYFKFQTRLKIGAGQTFTALPKNFEDVTIHGYSTAVRIEQGLTNNFLQTKWGPYTGGNFDFYFHPNVGFGLDLDYFNNGVSFKTPALLQTYLDNNPVTHLVESNRQNQHFVFLGLGPSFKLFTNEHWDLDLNIRAGLSHLQMGSLNVGVDSVVMPNNSPYRKEILQYDYSKGMNTAGLKAGLYANYWINSWVGVSLGIDFLHTFAFADKVRSDAAYVLKYKDPAFFKNSEGELNDFSYFTSFNQLDDYPVKTFNINHLAVSAGVVFRVKKEATVAKEKPKNIVVTVKDSMTKAVQPGVTVSLHDSTGTVIQTLTTDKNGKAVFENIVSGNYTLDGRKNEMPTNRAAVTRSEFGKPGKNIQKELLLNDLKFYLEGLTVECDNKDKIVGNVNIELTNKTTGKTEKLTSDASGNFSAKLDANTDYSIQGKRDGYYSDNQLLSTKGLSRSKTMKVSLKLCVEHLEVGKTFVLKNIYYDFDKCNIRSDAAVELNYLVDILKKYPTMSIELSSHTDQRGSDEYNNKLSQCRAESAVDYLAGKGISRSRVTAKGYGKTKLLQDCSKVEGCTATSGGDCPCHQNNRRTEVTVLKM